MVLFFLPGHHWLVGCECSAKDKLDWCSSHHFQLLQVVHHGWIYTALLSEPGSCVVFEYVARIQKCSLLLCFWFALTLHLKLCMCQSCQHQHCKQIEWRILCIIFIVASCILKIHSVSHTNKCTNCISYISLKLFALKHLNCPYMLKTFSLPTDAHNVKKHRVIKTF